MTKMILSPFTETITADGSTNLNSADPTGAGGAPLAPTGFTAVYLSDTSLSLAWTDNATNELNYELDRSPNGTDTWTALADPAANATSATSSGLTVDTQYFYRLRAVNAAGNSSYATANGTTTALTYVPFYAQSFQGTDGATIGTELISSGRTQYDNTVAGPHGETTNMRVSLNTGGNAFGGRLTGSSQAMSEGDILWLRWYQYIPTAFCAGYADSPADGFGETKWMRLQWGSSPYSRLYALYSEFAHNACELSSAAPYYQRLTGENFGGNSNQNIPTPSLTPRNQWVALQFAVNMSSSGWTRAWADDVYLGQVNDNMIPDNITSGLQDIAIGDYWNGSTPSNTEWYMQDIIATIDPPTTLDSGGRAYISPTTKAGDFA